MNYLDFNNILKNEDGALLEGTKETIIDCIKGGMTSVEAAEFVYLRDIKPLIDRFEEVKATLAAAGNEARVEGINSRIEKLVGYNTAVGVYAEDIASLSTEEVYEQIAQEAAEAEANDEEFPIVDFFEEKLAGDIYDQDKVALRKLIDEGRSVKDAVSELFRSRYSAQLRNVTSRKNSRAKKLDELQKKENPTDKEKAQMEKLLEEYNELDRGAGRLKTYRDYLKIFARKYYEKTHPKAIPDPSKRPAAFKKDEPTSLVKLPEDEAKKAERESFVAGLSDEKKAELEAMAGEKGETVDEALIFWQESAGLATLNNTLELRLEDKKRAATAEPKPEEIAPIAEKPEYQFTRKELRFLAQAGYDTDEKLNAYIEAIGYGNVKSGLYLIMQFDKSFSEEDSKEA